MIIYVHNTNWYTLEATFAKSLKDLGSTDQPPVIHSYILAIVIFKAWLDRAAGLIW